MENAAEALKMAAAVLVFVVALSISVNAFGQARQTSRMILDNQDREFDYTYIDGRDTSGNLVTERIVGIEEIIPTIYKAYKENYKIVFKTNYIDYLYEKRITSGTNKGGWKKLNRIDLDEKGVGVVETSKREFIDAIIYGTTSDVQDKFLRNSNIRLKTNDGIYKRINDKKLKEKSGVYIQFETDVDIAASNEDKKRVIIYTDI